jgi:hypothetical protein
MKGYALLYTVHSPQAVTNVYQGLNMINKVLYRTPVLYVHAVLTVVNFKYKEDKNKASRP